MAWKCAATNRLLEHIQDETGPQSRYIVGKTKALEEISNILKDELGTRFNPVQISNKIRSLWREHRNHDYRGHKDTEFAVLFTEGRGILDSYTNSEVLRRRGSETGMISPLAKKTIKDLGLTPSLWTGRREGEKRRLPGRERRGRRRTAKTSE